MKDFLRISFDAPQCWRELHAFRELLDNRAELREAADIKPFFDAHRNLSALIGSLWWEIKQFDLLSYQYQLFGDFGCDLVVGDSSRKAFGFVEFEDGAPDSIFRRQGQKAVLEWAPRFEHAVSQIVDWFWKLDDMERTDEYEARFGARHIRYFAVLVVGRDRWLTEARERRRLDWRCERVLVKSRTVQCLTYDQLYRHCSEWLDRFAPLPPQPAPPVAGEGAEAPPAPPESPE